MAGVAKGGAATSPRVLRGEVGLACNDSFPCCGIRIGWSYALGIHFVLVGLVVVSPFKTYLFLLLLHVEYVQNIPVVYIRKFSKYNILKYD